MKPGRELDALIAEKVMGIEPWPEQDPRWGVKAFKAKFVPRGQEAKPCQAPEYSTDIAAAWEVFKKLPEGWAICKCSTYWEVHGDRQFPDGTYVDSFWGDTAPHAICLAALKVVST